MTGAAEWLSRRDAAAPHEIGAAFPAFAVCTETAKLWDAERRLWSMRAGEPYTKSEIALYGVSARGPPLARRRESGG